VTVGFVAMCCICVNWGNSGLGKSFVVYRYHMYLIKLSTFYYVYMYPN